MGSYHAQTATEYLVITAVVIIIALIVVGALGGIPGIGGGAGEQVDAAQLRLLEVGIVDIHEDGNDIAFFLLNNQPQTIRLLSVSLEEQSCLSTPVTLNVGSRYRVTCPSGSVMSDVKIDWAPIGLRFDKEGFCNNSWRWFF
ncbi:MAG: hypothetical protein ACMXYF_02160 [Candidatus Woesearchaeota archaeon]